MNINKLNISNGALCECSGTYREEGEGDSTALYKTNIGT